MRKSGWKKKETRPRGLKLPLVARATIGKNMCHIHVSHTTKSCHDSTPGYRRERASPPTRPRGPRVMGGIAIYRERSESEGRPEKKIRLMKLND